MANLKDMEGPVKFDKGVELYYDPKKDMFYDEKKKKYVKEKDILKLVSEDEDLEDIEDIQLTSDLEGNLFEALSRTARLQKSRQMKRMSKRMALKRKMKMKRAAGQGELKKRARKMAINFLKKRFLKGRDISKLSLGEREKLESRIKKSTALLNRLELKFLKVVKQLDRDRRKSKNEEVDLFEKSEEYQKFFQSALKKFGVDSPAELDDKKKKEFFDYVDKNWEGEDEKGETVEEGCGSKHKKIKEDEEFKPHMMYDPKTGKAYKAEKPEDHERMSKLGYTHEKPKKIEEETVEENIEESRIRLSSLMNGGALLYDRDEDPDDDKLATVKVKGNPKKDIKNGDDLVLSLMDKGKSKEKEILKSLKKYYPKSKVVKEENIEEVKMHPALRKLQTALKKFHKGSELDDLVPEYGAKIVDGKKVYHIEYKKGKKEGEEFAKSLQKALKASSFSVMPYRGDDSMVSIEIKEETVSPKIAAYLNFLNKNLEEGKKDYEIYHKTFTSAIDEVKKFAKKNGYELDDDDLFHTVGTGPKKPSTGKTNKYHLKLIKGGKEDRKKLHFQVYGMKTQYELNMYIS